MTGLLALVLVACEHPGLSRLEPPQQRTACTLLARPEVAGPEGGAIEEIYTRPGFERAHRRDSGALAAWLAQLRARLMAFFETTGAARYSNVTRVLVLAAAALLLGLLSWRLSVRRQQRQARPGPAGGRSGPRLELDSPAAHLARARTLVDGAPRESLREALFALLSWLERARYARPDRVKTNRELASELASRGAGPGVIAAVAPLLEFYDRAFYSLEPVSAQSAGQFLAQVTPVVEAQP